MKQPRVPRWSLAASGAIALVLVHWVALFDGALLGGETYFARDLTPFFKPLLRLAARLWQEAAGLPLWNPYVSWGQPWLANPNAAPLHPLTLLVLLVGERAALVANVALPPLLGVGAMYFLLRERGNHPVPSLYGGLAWGFGGYLLSTTNLIAAVRTAAILPAALAFASRAAHRGRPGDVIGLAATAALVIAGLEPTILLAFLLLVAVAVAESPPTAAAPGVPAAGRRPRALLVALGLALALLAAAAVVVPVAELAPRTLRAAPLAPAEWSRYALAPPRLLEPFSPHLLGPVDFAAPERYWGAGWYGDKQLPYLASIYAGLLTVALALCGGIHAPRARRLWVFAGAGGLVLALSGNFPPWLAAVFRTPPLGQLRYTEKWAILPALAAVVLAAHALDRVLDGDRRHRRTVAAALASAAAVGALLAAVLAAAPGSALVRAALGITSASAAQAAAATAPREAALGLGFAAAYALALWSVRRTPRGGVALLLALAALDLYRTGKPLVPTAPRAWADAPPAVLEPLLRLDPPPRLFHLAEWQPACAGLSGVGWPPEPAGLGIPLAFPRDFDLTQLAWSHQAGEGFRALVDDAPDLLQPGLIRRGVGAVVLCTAGGTGATVELRLVEGPRRDLFCVDRVVVASGTQGWERAARDVGGAAPSTVILDATSVPSGVQVPERPSPCSVRLGASRPGFVAAEITATGPAPAVLAVNQTWHDRWRVELDGRPAALLRAEVCLAALVVPPGRHDLVLRYRDGVAVVAAWVSATTCAGLAAAALVLHGRRRTRRRAPPEPSERH